MVLKREDAQLVAVETFPAPGGSWGGITIDPTTVLNIPWDIYDHTNISVGGRGFWNPISIEPRFVIPTLAQPIIITTETGVLEQGDRRDQASIQGELPVVVMPQGWFPGDSSGLGNILAPDGSYIWNGQPGFTKEGIAIMQREAAQQPGGDDVSFIDDLGSIAGDVYRQIDAGWGGILPGGVPIGAPVPWSGAPLSMLPVGGGGGVVPPVLPPPVSLGGGGACPVIPPGYYMNKWGCLVKRKKKRRKQFFTQSDANQLSRLIAIAGKDTQLTKAWIASH